MEYKLFWTQDDFVALGTCLVTAIVIVLWLIQGS